MTTLGKNRYLTESLILAALPVLAYLITFSYQAGYATYFGIPLQIIKINLTTIIISSFTIVTSLTLVYVISNAVWMFTPKGNDPVSISIRRVVLVALIGFIIMVPFLPSRFAWVLYGSSILVILAVEFLFPILTQRSKAQYPEKLAAQNEIEIGAGKHMLWYEIDKRVGRWLITSVIYACIALGVAFGVGMQRAEKNSSYYISKNNAVVLSIYDDLAVLSPYDSKTITLSGELYFEKVGEGSTKVLRLEKIGQLKLIKNKKSNSN